MGLWNPLNRAITIAAGASVLAACYAVAAWGQVGPQAGARSGAGSRTMYSSRFSDSPIVTVASLRVPDEAWRHFERARSAASRHRDAEFERESAKALEIAPRFASMYLLRATVEVGASHYERAVASAQEAASVDPGAMWTTVVLAGAYNGMHRFRDALLVLDAKRGYEAETWQAMYERARAETGVGDAAAAMLWSGKALRTAPQEFIDAHLVRANALLLDGHLDEAAAQMDVYLQSKKPQLHRADVLALLDSVRAQIRTQNDAVGPHQEQRPAQQLASELASR